MPHAAIIGMQQSGKTTLALLLARTYRKCGFAVLVLDPHLNPQWQADWMTDNLEKFLRKAKASTRCALFVEETGDESEGEKPIGKQAGFPWLVTQAHHLGHVTHYLSQYHAQVPPVVRCNVRRLFLFSVGLMSARVWAEQFAQPALPDLVARLGDHQFIVTGTRRIAPRVCVLDADEVRRLRV